MKISRDSDVRSVLGLNEDEFDKLSSEGAQEMYAVMHPYMETIRFEQSNYSHGSGDLVCG